MIKVEGYGIGDFDCEIWESEKKPPVYNIRIEKRETNKHYSPNSNYDDIATARLALLQGLEEFI